MSTEDNLRKFCFTWVVSVESYASAPSYYKDSEIVRSECATLELKVRFWPYGINNSHRDYSSLGLIFLSPMPPCFNCSIVILNSNDHFMKARWCPVKVDNTYIDYEVMKNDTLFARAYDGLIKFEISIFFGISEFNYSSSKLESQLSTSPSFSNFTVNASEKDNKENGIPLKPINKELRKPKNSKEIKSAVKYADKNLEENVIASKLSESESFVDAATTSDNISMMSETAKKNRPSSNQSTEGSNKNSESNNNDNIKPGKFKIHAHELSNFEVKPKELTSAQKLEKLLERNSTGELIISSLSKGTISSVLDFIEAGVIKIPNFDAALQLLDAAKKFNIKNSQTLCKSYIKDNMNTYNVTSVLQLNDESDSKDLNIAANHYVVENFENFTDFSMFNLVKNAPPVDFKNMLLRISKRLPKSKH